MLPSPAPARIGVATAASGPRLRAAQARLPPPRRGHRQASTASAGGSAGLAGAVAYGAALAAALSATYLYATDTRAGLHRWLVPPLLRLLYPDAEEAHHAAASAMKHLYQLNLHPRERASALDPPRLSAPLFGVPLTNPVGISAGLDKDAEMPDALFALGAAVVEVGGCTLLPQAGNPRPRVFRVPALDAMVNRYGLNSRGADDVADRLGRRVRRFARSLGLSEADVLDGKAGVPPGSLYPGRLLAVQIAKNKETDERDHGRVAREYAGCARRLARYADVLVVNVSSPNTPGLRDLQAASVLTDLLRSVVREAAATERASPPKVMVKVSPDEDDDAQMDGIVQAVHGSGADGIIVGNTTKRRTGMVPPGVRLTREEQSALLEQGGFSGPSMFGRTLDLVARYRRLLDSYSLRAEAPDKEPKVIFATGGITTGQDALRVLNAGASVAMVYTGLVYGGAGTLTRIKKEMGAQT